jgi:RNA polymerase sigma factor (sigma-70 family)
MAKKKKVRLSTGKRAFVYVEVDKEGEKTVRELNSSQRKLRRKNAVKSLDEMKENKGFELSGHDPEPKEAAWDGQDVELLKKCLRYLPKTQRDVIRQVFFEKKKESLFAKENGISKVAVNHRIQRAVKALRKRVAKREKKLSRRRFFKK